MRVAPSNGVLGGAGKWITWLLTTTAAVTALLVNARNLGLTAWLGAVDVGFADHAASRVLVTPRADSLLAIGDTTMLAATVVDRRGAILTGARLHWSSEDTTVADVDSTGAVVARGPGRTRVSVHVRDLTSGASISVIQRPARVVITSEGAARLHQGETARFVAYAEDARGHRVRGLAPHWRSSDPAIVAIDSTGTATTGDAGVTTISALLGEVGATLSLQVDLTPAEAHLTSGDHQRALAGRRLLAPLVVQVFARGGRPVPGSSVAFLPEDGVGVLEPATAITDQEGRARALWTLSPRPGLQRVIVRVGTLDSALSASAEADPVPGTVRTELLGETPTGIAGTTLDDAVTIRVTDSLGAPLAMLPVEWITPDGGSAQGAERTDSVGTATARWALGRRMGRQRLLVQIGRSRSIPPFSIIATTTAGSPAQARLASGAGQRGVAGLPLPAPVRVQLQDAAGNPVVGQAVILRPGAGTVRDSVMLTDRTGEATTRWTLGPAAGEQTLRIAVEGMDSTLVVTARASAGPPATLTLSPLTTASRPGERQKVNARVADRLGNPVRNVAVRFKGRGGSVTPTEARSDDGGRVTVQWQPDPRGSGQRITASIAGTGITTTVLSGAAAPRKHD